MLGGARQTLARTARVQPGEPAPPRRLGLGVVRGLPLAPGRDHPLERIRVRGDLPAGPPQLHRVFRVERGAGRRPARGSRPSSSQRAAATRSFPSGFAIRTAAPSAAAGACGAENATRTSIGLAGQIATGPGAAAASPPPRQKQQEHIVRPPSWCRIGISSSDSSLWRSRPPGQGPGRGSPHRGGGGGSSPCPGPPGGRGPRGRIRSNASASAPERIRRSCSPPPKTT
jgi:hypothetical protein